jgi:NAD(P)-dependent dehydrogenase (short-subunit alcohol dehydrogenase family)
MGSGAIAARAALAAAGVVAGGAALAALRREPLAGKVVLITGGSRGLGLALAHEFGRAGCRVAICARDEPTLEQARVQLAAAGVDVLALPCDVTDKEQVAALIAAVTARFGRVDVLVANAVSSITVGPVAAHTAEDFEAAHAVLFWGVVYPALAVLPQMRERGDGRIVVVSSVGGKIAVPHMIAYSAAKFAALGFAEGLRAELAGSGVSVTTVAPGILRTGAHLHARYAGQPEAEFSWFAKGELSPGSVSAERAARQIVAAAARRAGEVVFPLSSLAMARLHGAFPNLVNGLMALMRRAALPDAPAGAAGRAGGLALERRARDPLLRAFQRWRRPELRELNQYPGEPAGR